jgi:hypothetical protein
MTGASHTTRNFDRISDNMRSIDRRRGQNVTAYGVLTRDNMRSSDSETTQEVLQNRRNTGGVYLKRRTKEEL